MSSQELDLKKIESLKQIPLYDIARSYGLKLSKAGDKWRTLCPFHNEQGTPSLFFYPNDSFYCFGGSCHKGGNKAKFISLMENVNINLVHKAWNLDTSGDTPVLSLTFKSKNDNMYKQCLRYVSCWCQKRRAIGKTIPVFLMESIDNYIANGDCGQKEYDAVIDFIKISEENEK